MKLALGTVQFGLDYGVSNAHGRPSSQEVRKILNFAWSEGIRCLDTAPAYGRSEEVIGEVTEKEQSWAVVTKTPYFNEHLGVSESIAAFERSLEASLAKTKKSAIYGLLFHDPKILASGHIAPLWKKALEAKASGVVKKVGFSVYNSADALAALKLEGMDLIQVPCNLFDQRILEHGIDDLKKGGVEVHARSVFLQGLLLMNPDSIPSGLHSIKPHLERVRKVAEKMNLSMAEAAMAFVIGNGKLDKVLVGVNTLTELNELVAISKKLKAEASDLESLGALAKCDDLNILNPSNWKI